MVQISKNYKFQFAEVDSITERKIEEFAQWVASNLISEMKFLPHKKGGSLTLDIRLSMLENKDCVRRVKANEKGFGDLSGAFQEEW